MFQFRWTGFGNSTVDAEAENVAKLTAVSKSQAMIEFAMDGTILTANENFLSLMGYTLDEVQGRHHSIFVDAVYRESAEYLEFWNNLRSGRFSRADYHRIAKGGKEVWIQGSYGPLLDKNGRPYKVVKVAIDITEAKKKALEDAGMIAAIGRSQAVISFNMDGTIITANEIFLKTMGYRLDEVQGRHHSMFVETNQRASQEYREFWQRLNRGEIFSGTFKRVGKSGSEVWIQGAYNPVLGLDGKVIRVVKVASDISGSVSLATKIEDVVTAVSAAATEMQASSDTMRSHADNGREKATTVAAATEELSTSIQEISEQINRAQKTTAGALVEAERSLQMVNGLDESATKIGEVVRFIRDIAEQTNLLALNATIEAARAGNAGKGFAVVAAEVKALATQTAKATGDISKQITDIQGATKAVVEANRAINTTVTEINDISAAVATAVEEQTAATQNVASNINDVSSGAEETGRNAIYVTQAAAELAQRSNDLLGQIHLFLRDLGVIR